jgi:hypothetical protein
MHKYRLISKKGEGTFSEVLKAQVSYRACTCTSVHIRTAWSVYHKCLAEHLYMGLYIHIVCAVSCCPLRPVSSPPYPMNNVLRFAVSSPASPLTHTPPFFFSFVC